MELFEKSSVLNVSAAEAFAWHTRQGALARLTPPWDPVEILETTGGLNDRGRATIKVSVGPLRVKWVAQHTDYEEGRMFRDVQESGPFKSFVHTHLFEPEGTDRCRLIDRIEFETPMGAIGKWMALEAIKRKMERAFTYRHRLTQLDLEAHGRYRRHSRRVVAVSGSGGLIGSALCDFLTTGGHRVVRIPRTEQEEGPWWNPELSDFDEFNMTPINEMGGIDAWIHLGGENIAKGRWSAARKKKLIESRVKSTLGLQKVFSKLDRKPEVFMCASAIGIYGNRGNEELSEESRAGEGFLAELCKAWEDAAMNTGARAGSGGIRTVRLRFGVVLSPLGGALKEMLTPFRFGLGGSVGSGEQYWSWVTLDDAIGVIYHCLMNQEVVGPVNVVSKDGSKQREFAKVLGRVLGRPSIVPLPGWAAKLAIGEGAGEFLLASQRVIPGVMMEGGYEYRDPELREALQVMLGLSGCADK